MSTFPFGGSQPGGGRYASLTGDGETETPGDLTQAGGLSIPIPSGDDFGFEVRDDGDGGINLKTNGAGGVNVVDTGSGGLNFNAEGATSSINIVDAGNGGLTVIEKGDGGLIVNNQGTGGLVLESTNDGGIELLNTGNGGLLIQSDGADLEGVTLLSPSNGFVFVTADVLANLLTPPTPPAWGFTQDGHVYFYPVGGPWTLKI